MTKSPSPLVARVQVADIAAMDPPVRRERISWFWRPSPTCAPGSTASKNACSLVRWDDNQSPNPGPSMPPFPGSRDGLDSLDGLAGHSQSLGGTARDSGPSGVLIQSSTGLSPWLLELLPTCPLKHAAGTLGRCRRMLRRSSWSSDLQRLGDARPPNPPGTYNWKASSCPPRWKDLPHWSGDPPSPSGCGADWSLQTWLARSVRIHLRSGLSPRKSHTSAKLLSYPQNHWSQSSAWNHSPRWDSGETSSATPLQIESSVGAPRPSTNPHEHSVRRTEAIEWCQWKWNSRFPADSAGTPPRGQAHLDAFASIRAVSFVPVSVLRSTGLCAQSSQFGPFGPPAAWAWTPGIANPRSRSVAWQPNGPNGSPDGKLDLMGLAGHEHIWSDSLDFYIVEHQKHPTYPKILVVHDSDPNLGRMDGYSTLLTTADMPFPALFSLLLGAGLKKKPLAWPPDQSIG